MSMVPLLLVKRIAPSSLPASLPLRPLTTEFCSEKPLTSLARMAKFWKSLSCIRANWTSAVLFK